MMRKCTKCGFKSTSLFMKKNRCWMCGSSTIVYRCQKLKDMAKPNKIERIDNKI
jgi:hypothetical protein